MHQVSFYCTCEYCQVESPSSETVEKTKTDDSNSAFTVRRKCWPRRASSISKEYNREHELVNTGQQHHFCYYYFNLWQSEVFKAKALEKENDRLERQVRATHAKLEKETLQQINISLKWRKTVMNLIDENARLKATVNTASKTTTKNT